MTTVLLQKLLVLRLSELLKVKKIIKKFQLVNGKFTTFKCFDIVYK